MRKQLLCGVCGEVVGDADYRRWRGRLDLVDSRGLPVQPVSSALELHRSNRPTDSLLPRQSDRAAAEMANRTAFFRRHTDELVFDMTCPRGHKWLRTAAQLVQAVKQASGERIRL